MLGNGFFGAIFTWLEQMLQPRGFDSGTAGLAGLLLLVGGIIGSAVLPGFASTPGRLRPVVIGPALLALPATALLLATPDRWVLLPAAAALGFCLLSPLPVLISLVQRMGGHASAGIALSLFWLAGNAGSAGITWLLSFPAQSGDWRLGGIFLAALLLIQGGLAYIALAPGGGSRLAAGRMTVKTRTLGAFLALLALAGCDKEDPAAIEARALTMKPASPALAEIYQRSCRTCHSVRDSGAPLTGDAASWSKRLAQRHG